MQSHSFIYLSKALKGKQRMYETLNSSYQYFLGKCHFSQCKNPLKVQISYLSSLCRQLALSMGYICVFRKSYLNILGWSLTMQNSIHVKNSLLFLLKFNVALVILHISKL